MESHSFLLLWLLDCGLHFISHHFNVTWLLMFCKFKLYLLSRLQGTCGLWFSAFRPWKRKCSCALSTTLPSQGLSSFRLDITLLCKKQNKIKAGSLTSETPLTWQGGWLAFWRWLSFVSVENNLYQPYASLTVLC